MKSIFTALAGVSLSTLTVKAAFCPDYTTYSQQYHAPFSAGKYNLSSQRPIYPCRTWNSTDVNELIQDYKSVIKDPDLYQLFSNAWPNSLDTTIAYHGYADAATGEESTFIITGDINAMWLRDSANQLQSYLSVLKPSNITYSIAGLYRGAINLQSRYLLINPYCNSFQAPPEAKIPPAVNGAAHSDMVKPPFNNQTVFECKYELDSLAAFLELSYNYYNATNDYAFFGKYKWLEALTTVLDTAEAMMTPTYTPNGSVYDSPYTFIRTTQSSEDTEDNSGAGNPVAAGTGLIRSAFRPSDDATIYQLFIPANMMFVSYLDKTAEIVNCLGNQERLYKRMLDLSNKVRTAISAHGIIHTSQSTIYAYEIDGFGSQNLMDDANIPSLLSAPLIGYTTINDPVYQASRARILSSMNPYFMRGPVINAVGGPHDGPGYAWPMASIVRILTSDNDTEIKGELKQLVSSTDGLGLIHESINTFNQSDWTRQWFSWANGLFGQMIIDLHDRKPGLLGQSYQ